jgi:hypothetical protein
VLLKGESLRLELLKADVVPELVTIVLFVVGIPWALLRMARYVEGDRVAVATFGMMTCVAVGSFVLGGYLGRRAGRTRAIEEAKWMLKALARAFDDPCERQATAIIRSCPACGRANRIPMKVAFESNICTSCGANIPTSAEGIGTEYAPNDGNVYDRSSPR